MSTALSGWLARVDRPRFFRELNLFIPLFVYGWDMSFVALEAYNAQAGADGGPGYDYRAQPWLLLAWAAVLILIGATVGLSPRGLTPGRERRHQLGQFTLAAINFTTFCTALLPLLLANLTGIEALGQLMWIGIPILALAHCLWPFGLWMVWSSRGAVPIPATQPAASPPASWRPTETPQHPAPSQAPSSARAARAAPRDVKGGWRVGHVGRDCMYYEEQIDGRWERIEISGEMLMGPAHHVIYFASPQRWTDYPAWAASRRSEIIARIKSRFRPPDYEYQGA